MTQESIKTGASGRHRFSADDGEARARLVIPRLSFKDTSGASRDRWLARDDFLGWLSVVDRLIPGRQISTPPERRLKNAPQPREERKERDLSTASRGTENRARLALFRRLLLTPRTRFVGFRRETSNVTRKFLNIQSRPFPCTAVLRADCRREQCRACAKIEGCLNPFTDRLTSLAVDGKKRRASW